MINNLSLDKRRAGKFRIGDMVKIKPKTYYGYGKKFFISHIFVNGDIVLRRLGKEDETLERYTEEELIPSSTYNRGVKHDFFI